MNDNMRLSDILRDKLKIIEKDLSKKDMVDKISQELAGYIGKEDSKVPEYRKISVSPVAWNPARGWIPIQFEDEETKKYFSNYLIRDSLFKIEQIVLKKESYIYAAFELNIDKKYIWAFWQKAIKIDKRDLLEVIDKIKTEFVYNAQRPVEILQISKANIVNNTDSMKVINKHSFMGFIFEQWMLLLFSSFYLVLYILCTDTSVINKEFLKCNVVNISLIGFIVTIPQFIYYLFGINGQDPAAYYQYIITQKLIFLKTYIKEKF